MAGFRYTTRLVYLFTLCAVAVVVWVNIRWHTSQQSNIPVSASENPDRIEKAIETPPIVAANTISEMLSKLESTKALQGGKQPATEAAPSRPAETVHDNSKRDRERIHTVTYASHGGRDDRFCRAVESALRHDIDLVILGWGVAWKGLSQKLDASHAYAAALPAEDVMLFTDAFDVMFTNSSRNILRIFESMDTNILFAGECGCWPHVMEDNGRPCFRDYPKAPTPYRYLNSGTWIAKAGYAKEMLLAVIQEAGKNFANANDQKLVADMYMQGRFGIKLDFYSQIFQSMHMTLSKPLPICNPTKDVKINNGHFHNSLTNTDPSVFHFNGGGKSVHLEMVSILLSNNKNISYDGVYECIGKEHMVQAPRIQHSTGAS